MEATHQPPRTDKVLEIMSRSFFRQYADSNQTSPVSRFLNEKLEGACGPHLGSLRCMMGRDKEVNGTLGTCMLPLCPPEAFGPPDP